jgi:hypothetical protein
MEDRIMHIRNASASVVISGYALDHANRIILLDIAPLHPKKIGAIWAEMVSGSPRSMQLEDANGNTYNVFGKGSAYTRIPVDVPEIYLPDASRAKARFLRLLFPAATRILRKGKDGESNFYAFEWPDMTAGRALAAMLERDTPYPMLLDWGDAILNRGKELGFIRPLVSAGTSPAGYEVHSPADGWPEFISLAVQEKIVRIE